MPRTPRLPLASSVLVACLLLTAGCGDDSEPAGTVDLPGGDSASSGAASSASTPTAEPPTARDDEPVDGKVLLGRSAASSAEEREVVDVWFAYWTEVNRMYREVEADPDTLYSLAKDAAATGPLDYLEEFSSRGERLAGGSIVAASKVRVRGDEATVDSCFRNSSVNVDAQGKAVELLTPFFTTREVLRREGPDWRVETSTTTSRNERCRFR